jgi:hypothetical protein
MGAGALRRHAVARAASLQEARAAAAKADHAALHAACTRELAECRAQCAALKADLAALQASHAACAPQEPAQGDAGDQTTGGPGDSPAGAGEALEAPSEPFRPARRSRR